MRSVAPQAGISEGLWRQIESGARVLAKDVVRTVNPKPSTRAAVSLAIGWSDDSIDRILRGEPPMLLDQPAPTGRDYLGREVALPDDIIQLRDLVREHGEGLRELVETVAALQKQSEERQRQTEERLARLERRPGGGHAAR